VKLRRMLFCFLVGAALLFTSEEHVFAQEPPARKRVTAAWDDKQFLHIAISYREIVDPVTVKKLQSGLPTTIVTRAGFFRVGENKPLGGIGRTCVVTFDLWDELYHLKINGGPDEVVISIDGSPEGVLRRCAELELTVPRWALASKGEFYLLASASVNPVSSDMVDRIKRWVTRPVGTNVAAGDALFGSFVDLFVTRGIGDADRVLEFRQTIIP
jgi:hypothetical protein